MKRIIQFVLAVFMCCQFASAQKASDVLERGIRIEPGKKLFLQYNKTLKFDVAKSLNDPANPLDFTTLEDSAIFLVSKNGLNVYLQPLNPLNFRYNTETKVVIDPISEAAASAIGSIIGVFGLVAPATVPEKPGNQNAVSQVKPSNFTRCENLKESLQKEVYRIQKEIVDSKKSKIVEIFKRLKTLDFADDSSTNKELSSIKASIKEIEDHFKSIESLMAEAIDSANMYYIICNVEFNDKYIFNTILKDLLTTIKEQQKRLANLEIAYDLVEKTQNLAHIGGGVNGLKWCLHLDEVPSKEGKISEYSITIKESGYKLSDNEEIVSIESKDVLKKTVRIRKFQLFVPEVSSGVVYTFFHYNSYGTTTDSTGQQLVASPTENNVKNINIAAMINWNLYSPDSPISPLIQIGAGINSEIPTILTGVGLRFSNNAKNRIRITGGLAMTWLKELDNLKEGEKVSGTDEINKDLKYSPTPKFAPYIGLQYNF